MNPAKPPDERPARMWDCLVTSDWTAASEINSHAHPHALEGSVALPSLNLGSSEIQLDIFLCLERLHGVLIQIYRGTSLIRNSPLLGHCSRTLSRALW